MATSNPTESPRTHDYASVSYPIPPALGSPLYASHPARPQRSSRKGKHAQNKQPQRGLGVAQLEKLRVEEENKQQAIARIVALHRDAPSPAGSRCPLPVQRLSYSALCFRSSVTEGTLQPGVVKCSRSAGGAHTRLSRVELSLEREMLHGRDFSGSSRQEDNALAEDRSSPKGLPPSAPDEDEPLELSSFQTSNPRPVGASMPHQGILFKRRSCAPVPSSSSPTLNLDLSISARNGQEQQQLPSFSQATDSSTPCSLRNLLAGDASSRVLPSSSGYSTCHQARTEDSKDVRFGHPSSESELANRNREPLSKVDRRPSINTPTVLPDPFLTNNKRRCLDRYVNQSPAAASCGRSLNSRDLLSLGYSSSYPKSTMDGASGVINDTQLLLSLSICSNVVHAIHSNASLGVGKLPASQTLCNTAAKDGSAVADGLSAGQLLQLKPLIGSKFPMQLQKGEKLNEDDAGGALDLDLKLSLWS